jgi:arabinosaccharide transport system substrate-binding protein
MVRDNRHYSMQFSPGRPILALLVASLASGLLIARRPAGLRADLVLWSFDEAHVQVMRDGGHGPSLVEQFMARTGRSVSLELMGEAAENIRLAEAFTSGPGGPRAPDVCEIEIHSIGQFLRPPGEDIGLLPLNDFLRRSEWGNRILASRFAAWSKVDRASGKREIYGIPEDIHPVVIAYRKDLFDEAGIDLAAAKSWREFQAMGLAFQRYAAARGYGERRTMGLSSSAADEIVEMLLQRHVNLIDEKNRLHFTDAKTLETVMFYAGLISGDRAIGGDAAPGVSWTEQLARGTLCGVMAPDWKVDEIRRYEPALAGKIALMPLPRFDAGDAPTSTFGGTMMGISRASRDPAAAWALLEHLTLSEAAHRAAIAAGDDVLPAEEEYWSDPAYHRSDAYFFDSQSPGDLFVRLAPEIPERVVTPYTFQAELALAIVVRRAMDFQSAHGAAGLREACAGWLEEAQEQIRQRMEFGSLDP